MLEIFSECVVVIVIVKLALKEEWGFMYEMWKQDWDSAQMREMQRLHMSWKRDEMGSHRCTGGHRLERCVAQDDRMIILVQALWYFEVWHTIVALCRMSQAFGGREVE